MAGPRIAVVFPTTCSAAKVVVEFAPRRLTVAYSVVDVDELILVILRLHADPVNTHWHAAVLPPIVSPPCFEVKTLTELIPE